jgi:hypothetical protein
LWFLDYAGPFDTLCSFKDRNGSTGDESNEKRNHYNQNDCLFFHFNILLFLILTWNRSNEKGLTNSLIFGVFYGTKFVITNTNALIHDTPHPTLPLKGGGRG